MFQIESLDLVENGLTVQNHSVNGIGKFQAEILMETAEGDYKEGERRWNQIRHK